MSIWIRSQDKKKLIEAKDIAVGTYWKGDPNKEKSVINVYGGDGEEVASYPIEQRALEVMDEIEHFIKGEIKYVHPLESEARCLFDERTLDRVTNEEIDTWRIATIKQIDADEKAKKRIDRDWYLHDAKTSRINRDATRMLALKRKSGMIEWFKKPQDAVFQMPAE